MKQVIVFAAGLSLLLSASVASAQSYSFYSVVSTGTCANLTSDLTVGSRGTQVRSLQTFLVAQNYPGGGNWMITGTFGQATAAAVRNFQQVSGLQITGWVDGATRAAINQASCPTGSGYSFNYNNYNGGNYNYGSNNSYGYNNSYYQNYTPNNGYYNNTVPTYNYTNTYPYNYNYNYGNQNGYNNCGVYPYFYSCYSNTGAAPVLSSLSPNYGGVGTVVTVYGSGFDSANNIVYVGGTTLRNIVSNNGTSVTFTMPSSISGSASVSVGNSYGVSNSLTFQASGNPVTCGTYPYAACGCASSSYGYGTYCPPPVAGQVAINYITPTSGGVGTSVTIYGWNFSRNNNTVHFGNGIIASLNSYDGTSLSFTVPTQISGYGYQPIGLGSYNISVTNGAGVTSNTVPFTITSLNGSGNSAAPSITSVTGPTSLGLNTQGTWTVQFNNNQTNSYTTTSVNWGDQNVYGSALSANQTSYAQGTQTMTFTHAYATAGTYTVIFTVTGVNGLSNTSSATVTVSSTGNGLTLTSIAPNAGHIGTQIMLQGSGFSATDNTVFFGIGGMLHVPSFNNGTLIYYTVPQYLSPCDVAAPGLMCAINVQQLQPGPVQVKVGNGTNTSQIVYFQVQ